MDTISRRISGGRARRGILTVGRLKIWCGDRRWVEVSSRRAIIAPDGLATPLLTTAFMGDFFSLASRSQGRIIGYCNRWGWLARRIGG